MLTFDDVLEEVGGFGLYQKITFFFVCLTSAAFAYLYVGFVFLAVTPDHWCRSPGVTELRDKCNWSLEQEKNYTLPVGQSGSSSYSQCETYDIDWNSSSGSCENPLLFVQNGSQDLPRTTCQDGWVFENGSISSIVTEFELVCADSWKLDLSQACLNLGFTLGTVIMGYGADRFGRKSSFLFATFVTSALGLVVPFLPNYTWFLIFRTLQGLFSKGSWVCAYVFITELVGLQYRRTVGILYQVCFSSGMMLLAAVAYFIPDWRNLQLATTIPGFFFLTYYWLIPESPRWMLSQKKNTEAVNVIQQMAKRNGKSFSKKIEIVEEHSEDFNRPSFVELVRTPQMRKHTFILTFNWNLGVSACSSLCDIGGIAAPFIVYRLSEIWMGLPLVVLGVLGLIVGGLVLLLPETKGMTLPDTVEDVENLRRPKKKILKTHHQQSVLYSTDVKDPASVKMVVEG
ncbi:solute carrier family 22 member 2-like isoform X4 [Chiloscyllium plagiosum]|uniref:solute carrier family 22 member 2-like isoform X4 n=1 Tax=Chiloscyllium plagiosum TaxID=36176 RepID=UPI001CB7C520|nr:solute carrier family 22 member 2-like isoform X4 [Chiloscyllium plagiosum]